jgi:hypothetical protein
MQVGLCQRKHEREKRKDVEIMEKYSNTGEMVYYSESCNPRDWY